MAVRFGVFSENAKTCQIHQNLSGSHSRRHVFIIFQLSVKSVVEQKLLLSQGSVSKFIKPRLNNMED